MLLTTPLVSALRQRWPAVHIAVLGFAGTLALLQGNDEIDERIEVRRGDDLAAKWRLLRRLWRRYDLALVTQAGDRPALYGWIAARRRASVAPEAGTGHGAWWKRRLAQHRVVADRNRHTVLEKLLLVEPWIDLETQPVSVHPPAAAPLPEALAQALSPGYLVVHAPSMWQYKQWPVAHFRSLVAALLADGRQVVLTGSSAPRDQQIIAQLRDLGSAPQLLDASQGISLAQVATLLAGARAYVGPDTSVTHLAASLGTPLVALFGPTRPTAWGPWPQPHPARGPWALRGPEPLRVQRVGKVILMQGPSRPGDDCVPCGRAGCDDHRDSRSECLERLSPQQVLEQLATLT
ncbi:glycosyltransferase family 9 protein [Piscinibacter sakaiensis]|uniref:glycosyltransferase family 9 protein n=1 Tax=Piscinibacter sakaiensis TaxID=1547922 RepID=UPI003AAFBEAE